MIELFIELTDQLFWEGYAQQLAREDPASFQQELKGFLDSYNGQQQLTTNKQQEQLTKNKAT